MKQTFELFLQGPDGREWFVALTCKPEELMTLAQQTIAQEGAVQGDVRQFGQPMFSLAGQSPT